MARKASMNFWRVAYIVLAFLAIWVMAGDIGVYIALAVILMVGILTIVMNWLIGD